MKAHTGQHSSGQHEDKKESTEITARSGGELRSQWHFPGSALGRDLDSMAHEF